MSEDSERNDDGTEAPSAQRGRSTVVFPYDDIDAALEIVKVVHNRYGGFATVDDVAGALNQKPTSGAFRVKLSSARIYTFVTTDRDGVRSTHLGVRALTDKRSRAEGFLAVELYGKLFEQFKHALPGDTGLEAAIASAGVTAKQVQTARQVFTRSAEQAGFFEMGRNRLVMPGPGRTDESDDQGDGDNHDDDDEQRNGPSIMKHPLILGLLSVLPEPGKDFPAEERAMWLKTLDMNLSYIYPTAKGRQLADETVPDRDDG